jgi:Ca2+-binding EF-hand superfamily protein
MLRGMRITPVATILLLVSVSHAADPSARPAMTKAQQMLQKFDADRNGKLEGAELQAARADAKTQREAARQAKAAEATNAKANREALLRQFDLNRNGQLDAAETDQLQRVWSHQGVNASGTHSAAGSGSADTKYLKLFDHNRNGRLEPAEVRALKDELARRPPGELKPPRPPGK